MSFCPTKDIHSVYLDNELPEEHRIRYEKHIQECEKCRAQLERLKAVRKLFQNDASTVTPDEHYLDDSYQRLMIKMSYARNASKARKPSRHHFTYILSAAAAVLVALFVPTVVTNQKQATPQTAEASETPISTFGTMPAFGNNISFGSGNRGMVSGMMRDRTLPSYIPGFSDPFDYSGYGTDFPNFGFNDDGVISIRVSIPGFTTMPYLYLDSNFAGLAASGNDEWNHPEN